jgi:hypothetical protein
VSQLHAPVALYPGENPSGTHWKGGWMSRRAGLNKLERTEILPRAELELRPLGLPVRSISLYRLRYPGSHNLYNTNSIPSLNFESNYKFGCEVGCLWTWIRFSNGAVVTKAVVLCFSIFRWKREHYIQIENSWLLQDHRIVSTHSHVTASWILN